MKLRALLWTIAISATHSFTFVSPSGNKMTNSRQNAFITTTATTTTTASTALHMSSTNDEEKRNTGSRLSGNRREPSIQEISVMDDMISKLIEAKPYELPNAVSKAIRVISSPRFFLRIAERADMATNEVEKTKLSNLATNLISTIDAVVSSAEDKLEDRAKLVEKIVKAASEPTSGEFLVPLPNERLEDMKKVISKINPNDLDEGFLSTVDAWMNKSSEDGLDGMVVILQKVLQIYAGVKILSAKTELQANVGAALAGESPATANKIQAEQEAEVPKPAALLLDKLLGIDTELWDGEIKQAFQKQEVAPKSLMGEVQRIIEAVVLGLENGSMAQRVQAEFLKELVTRIETIEKQS
mmetsp:Transcript_10349/g.11438  ORF Transcript_10349/g.11438 Transcript_10349/m.11438 type:complete len:356 (-) Transcript_10349:32-1099(-)